MTKTSLGNENYGEQTKWGEISSLFAIHKR